MEKGDRKIIASNSIVDETVTTNEIEIGNFTIGQMLYAKDSVWIENNEGEGGQFRKAILEPILKEFFNKYF